MTGIWKTSWLDVMVGVQPHTWRLMFRQTWLINPDLDVYGDLG
jgi:hypothetical protein